MASGSSAPTPYTADQIREGCPPGRSVTIRVIDDEELASLWTTTFVECDDEGTMIESRQTDPDGELLGETVSARVTWEELRRHAEFPESATTIKGEEITTPVGSLDCLRYEITTPDAIKLLWFARSLPGQPVRTAIREAGKTVVTSEIVADTMPPPIGA